ncbi:hypothetical protein DCAR_0521365 [Daucus carota subsp. sativus]|uniref:Trichome birefringence-like N-terminal domain-containing protein n=1 Tax=Daucus carota subsp. sativus TaxID=79200 RepID=A0AAF0X5U6_DAUCS|nr:PREDICTED: protein trichome birefringence-like 34 [Daucus carota subsp. sativus]WOH01978.1 hypothetical protein DCAR_0521365 [Daucus carota subsp. sativus]
MKSLKNWIFGTLAHNRVNSVLGFSVMALLLAAIYLTRDATNLDEYLLIDEESPPQCDLFSGKWVFDHKFAPSYNDQQCSFMTDDYACQKFGRNESIYQHWRWQPHDCDLSRFNATTLLEKFRGKRITFVGDSLNKNQWTSLLCLIESSIPPSERFVQWNGSLATFKTSQYDGVSIQFYWEPLLVESNCDDPAEHHVLERVINVHKIEKHAMHWKDADILIFDSFMWWLSPKMTVLQGSSQNSEEINNTVERTESYKMALKTWTDWLNLHVNQTKTQLFFMSFSPYHHTGEDWGKNSNTNCYNETEPILDEGFVGSGLDRGMIEVAENAVRELQSKGLKVQYVNITNLSDRRKEAHPSIYRKQWKPPTEKELANPSSYSDCVHWCLPGVPDIWNQLLYAYILQYT